MEAAASIKLPLNIAWYIHDNNVSHCHQKHTEDTGLGIRIIIILNTEGQLPGK